MATGQQTPLSKYERSDRQQAKQADYVAFTGRHPFCTDAFELGYTVGFREDGGFQDTAFPNVDLPMGFLDNDFRNPDLDRFLDRVDRYEPDVAVVGDAESIAEAERYQQAADHIRETYDDVEPVIVPKCRNALDVIGEGTVAGWPNGYANVEPLDYTSMEEWRGRRVHVLGGSPPDQYAVIDQLTQPTLNDAPPADIVGIDGNGVMKAAYFGEYWTPYGYEPADHLSIRATVRRSLSEIKGWWQDRGVWPEETPNDVYGPAVVEPDDPVYAENGGDIETREDLESAYVGTYDDRPNLAFASETAKRFVEYRDDL